MARLIDGGQGLAVVFTWAGLVSAPYGILHGKTALLNPYVLWVAVVVAVASSVLPCSLNLEALRRIPPRVFGVLTSLEPAAGAVFGLSVPGQHLSWPQWLGIAAVVGASVTAALTSPEKQSRVRATGSAATATGAAGGGG